MSLGQTSFIHAELERRKPTLKTQLVWIGALKEPGLTSRTWKWVNGEFLLCCYVFVSVHTLAMKFKNQDAGYRGTDTKCCLYANKGSRLC